MVWKGHRHTDTQKKIFDKTANWEIAWKNNDKPTTDAGCCSWIKDSSKCLLSLSVRVGNSIMATDLVHLIRMEMFLLLKNSHCLETTFPTEVPKAFLPQ